MQSVNIESNQHCYYEELAKLQTILHSLQSDERCAWEGK